MFKKNSDFSLLKLNNTFYLHSYKEDYELNETAARIVDLCNGRNSNSFIKETLAAHFNMAIEDIQPDIDKALKYLANTNIIMEVTVNDK